MTIDAPATDLDRSTEVRRALELERDALRARLGRLDELPEGSWCGDPVDVTESRLQVELFDAAVQRDRLHLEQAERAIQRLDAGLHGRCEVCGGTIPAARLDAFPRATTCVGCA